jgi:hypothetical protein
MTSFRPGFDWEVSFFTAGALAAEVFFAGAFLAGAFFAAAVFSTGMNLSLICRARGVRQNSAEGAESEYNGFWPIINPYRQAGRR